MPMLAQEQEAVSMVMQYLEEKERNTYNQLVSMLNKLEESWRGNTQRGYQNRVCTSTPC